jgi:23S rRNA (adenine2030-N6)-methyltransferase
VREDGYDVAVEAANDDKDLFYLIDPPFEKADDYARIVETTHAILSLRIDARLLIWLPLKDLETFDSWLRAMEREVSEGDLLRPVEVIVAELRLRSLWNPMKMNGCALVAICGAITGDFRGCGGDFWRSGRRGQNTHIVIRIL